MDLFDPASARAPDGREPSTQERARPPLAERLRPTTLEEVVGHLELTRPTGGFLRLWLAARDRPSLIFWGPPGSGKTTLARVLANGAGAHFEPFSAVLGGVNEVREIVERARDRKRRGVGQTLLFVDEIHRFNKGQQDAFLPHVEDGTLLLVGATTENPSFSLNAALLSRCRVVPLAPLMAADLVPLLARALADARAAWTVAPPAFAPEALALIAEHADGDARRALGDLELVVQAAPSAPLGGVVTAEVTAALIGARVLRGDKTGDSHFDLASALIKSLRASDPDAALYYAARLLEGGEDPRFVLRRLVIFASEDVGNADPRALGVAVDAAVGFERIGMPEGRILIGQAVTYLATAPKSNAAYLAIDKALEAVRRTGVLPVPLHLRNAPTKLMQALGHGEGYQFAREEREALARGETPHDHGGFVPRGQPGNGPDGPGRAFANEPGHHLPEALRGTVFYAPSGDGYEKQIAERLGRWRAARDGGGREGE